MARYATLKKDQLNIAEHGLAPKGQTIEKEAEEFFGRLTLDPRGKSLLEEQQHRIEFVLTDGPTFHLDVRKGELRVVRGASGPQRLDVPDLIHFRLATASLQRLFRGEIRFTDALIPTAPDGRDTMLLLECTLFKWGVLSWVGRMFRTAQLLPKQSERPSR